MRTLIVSSPRTTVLLSTSGTLDGIISLHLEQVQPTKKVIGLWRIMPLSLASSREEAEIWKRENHILLTGFITEALRWDCSRDSIVALLSASIQNHVGWEDLNEVSSEVSPDWLNFSYDLSFLSSGGPR